MSTFCENSCALLKVSKIKDSFNQKVIKYKCLYTGKVLTVENGKPIKCIGCSKTKER